MYENMTVLPNKEYAELVIKANKYDQLRKMAVESKFTSTEEDVIFELTAEELQAIKERRMQNEL